MFFCFYKIFSQHLIYFFHFSKAMAAQQQQRLAAAASANVNNASRNKAAIAAFNAMRNRGRPNTVTKNTPGGTVLQNSPYNKSQMNTGMMLSNNYQMAAAQLAAANSQLLQQVVVSFYMIDDL